MPEHLIQILDVAAAQEGKDIKQFAKDGLLGYCRGMGYLSIYDDINIHLRTTNIRI